MYDNSKVKIQWQQEPSPGKSEASASLSFNLAYQEYITKWEHNYACYKGIEGIIKANLIGPNPRESAENWVYRRKQLCGPNFTKGVVDAYCAHLARKQGQVNAGSLQSDELFNLFLQDADYTNTEFLKVFTEEIPYSTIFGAVGYLVDMPAFDNTIKIPNPQAIKDKLYPYITTYYPPNILDWQYSRDQYGRPILVFIKLLDDDGYIRCWWDLGDRIRWEMYNANIAVLPNVVGQSSIFTLARNIMTQRIMPPPPVKIAEGETNTIKYIPFELQYNRSSGIKMIGEGDVDDISRLDLRFTNNLSRISEIADIAAFPILLMPRERECNVPAEMPIGPTSVLSKGPEAQDTPEWLAAEVADPIKALWEDNDKIREELYRVSLFGGTEQTTGGNNTGPALNLKYQQLGARLVEKASSIQQAANGCLYHYCSWLGILPEEQPQVMMPTDYNIEDLAADIDAAVKATNFVGSDAFRREERKVIVNKMLPNLPIEVQEEINKEIEEAKTLEEQNQEKLNVLQPGVAENSPLMPKNKGQTEEEK